MSINRDSSPVFMEIKSHFAWDKTNPDKLVSTKQSKMKNWYKDGKFLDYITRDEAALSFDISDENFTKIMDLEMQQATAWSKFKEEHSLDPDDRFLTSDELEIKESFNEPINKLITELRDGSPTFSGLNMMSVDESGNRTTTKVSDDDIQKEYDSFKHLQINNQPIWTGVVSFSNDFMQENKPITPGMINKEMITSISRMLKKSGWSENEINKAKIGWAHHINTDNLHAHFYIYQPKPTRWLKDKNFQGFIGKYAGKYAMNRKSLLDFRMQFDKNLSQDVKAFYRDKDDLNKWIKSFHSNVWTQEKAMYQKLNNEWNVSDIAIKKVLVDLKEFQTKNKSEIEAIKSGISSKQVSENFRKKMRKLSEQVINDIPEWSERRSEFKNTAKQLGDKKFEKYLLYYKTPTQVDGEVSYSGMDMEIEKIYPDDPKLSISDEDIQNFEKRRLETAEIDKKNYEHRKDEKWQELKHPEFRDAYEFLKNKKIEFEQEYLYHFNDKGFAQGLEVNLSQQLLNMMKHPIRIPTGKQPKKNEIKTNKFSSAHSYKNLTNKRMTNLQYHLKKSLNQIDKRMRKLELEAEKKFKQLEADLEKSSMEEQKQWNN